MSVIVLLDELVDVIRNVPPLKLRPLVAFPPLSAAALTSPPFSIFSVPVPAKPTSRAAELIHVEPLPLTVTVPLLPGELPMLLPTFVTRPPPVMFIVAGAQQADRERAGVGPGGARTIDGHNADAACKLADRAKCVGYCSAISNGQRAVATIADNEFAELVQVEPGPSTVTKPSLPTLVPRKPMLLDTSAPL